MEKKLIECPIDNKNLMEDPFEDEVFCDGFMQAYDHRDGSRTRHLIGRKDVLMDGIAMESGIVDVRWKWGDNCVYITLLAVSGCSNSADWEETRQHIFNDYRRTFESWECEDNPGLVVRFGSEGDSLYVHFYYDTTKC